MGRCFAFIWGFSDCLRYHQRSLAPLTLFKNGRACLLFDDLHGAYDFVFSKWHGRQYSVELATTAIRFHMRILLAQHRLLEWAAK